MRGRSSNAATQQRRLLPVQYQPFGDSGGSYVVDARARHAAKQASLGLH
jgi:hypothetical protein